ncbi:MAG: zinc ribbon domain-containing protein [Ruminococcaceae bacterium]|nr:zinc ribbon domain-containing protein [Oscillospiraceae bacterium]
MYKKCSKCGAEIPKEAVFCLKCFSAVEVSAPVDNKKKTPVFFKIRSYILKLLKSRRFRLGFAGVAGLLLVMGICILIMKNVNTTPPPVVEQTSVIHLTETVAVTQNNGEFVTAENGEQVFDIVDVTQTIILPPASTTQKQGFLENLFNNKTTSPQSNNDTPSKKEEEETEKKNFWETIFGNDETTEAVVSSTTKPSSATTVPPTANTTTTTPSTSAGTTATTESSSPTTTDAQVSTDDFEYTISGKYATITKYTGNSANVIIPAVVEGCAVTRIEQNTFQNNSSIVNVSFETNSKQPYLWVEQQTFNSCPNLRFINFSETDLGIINDFATNCPSVENISVTGYQFKCIDGTLYYNTGSTWKVRYHCPAHPTTEIRLPNNCAGFESAINLEEAYNVKNIYMNKNATSYPSSDQLPPNCENIFVDGGNPKGYDIGGVAFFKNGDRYICIYPSKNNSQSLTLPENTLIYCQQINNPYLKTLYMPSTTNAQYLDYVLSKRSFSSLENLYFGAEHSKASYVLTHSDIANTQLY